MKNWKFLLPLMMLLVSISWFACRDQEYDGYEPEVDVAFAGRVIDEQGAPIEGAQVRAGNELAVTDANGVFRLKPTDLPARDARLYVSRIGYFDFSRAFIVRDGALQTVTVQLLQKELVGTVNNGTGGTVSVPGGVQLNFPAGAVATSGQVYVYAKYLDPTSPDLPLQMPGDLRAVAAGGEEGTLATFGMIGVELTDQSGNPVQVANGSEVEISMPIPADKLSVAPASIALWYYDHDSARWIEEGTAQKSGDRYIGKVKHFSFWNCDAFSATVYMDGQVFLLDDQHPFSEAIIRLTVLSNGFQGFGYTNTNGWYGGAVPKDYAMKLEVLLPGQCGGQVLYAQDIGPFSTDVTLPPIIITSLPPSAPVVDISGKVVDCNGQNVANGYTIITIGGKQVAAFTAQDGSFETNLVNCYNADAGTAVAYDLDQFLESNTQDFNIVGNDVDLGNIAVCNALTEYIKYTLDGQSFTKIEPFGGLYPDTLPNTTVVGLNTADSLSQNNIYMSFPNGNNQIGTYPLEYLYVNDLIAPAGSALTITLATTANNVGDVFEGTFSGNFTDQNGTSHTISGSYRVIRDW